MRLSILLALIFLTLSTQAAPKPKPAANNDGSAPRAALLMYDKLVGPHESEKALPLYYADTTRDKAVAQILAKCDGAIAYLHQTASEKFGPEFADAIIQTIKATTTQDINDAKIVVAGDQALVTFPGHNYPTTMVKIKGEWKISVKAMTQEVDNLRTFRKALTQMAISIDQIADKIAQGQYQNAEEPTKKLKEEYEAIFKSKPE